MCFTSIHKVIKKLSELQNNVWQCHQDLVNLIMSINADIQARQETCTPLSPEYVNEFILQKLEAIATNLREKLIYKEKK